MIKIAILTPLALEKDAVLKHLKEAKSVVKNGELYHIGYFSGQHHEFEVVVKKTGAGNETVTLAAEKIIVRYSPQVLFLTGIAGGVKDVAIGDVVIGTQAHGYDIGKETEGGFKARPESYPAHKSLINLAELVADSTDWQKRNPTERKSKVLFGPIASGNKVITSINHSTYKIIKSHYNNTVALEMEAFGVGKALHNHPSVHWMNVRSISDLLVGKNEEEDLDNQPFAAAQAAAFLFEMLNLLNAKELNLSIMDAKELSKAVFNILFPVTRLESVKEIGKELTEATDNSVRELWEKVKPLFVEEMEELESDPKDEDNQAAVRMKIKKVLAKEENADLKREVEEKVKDIAKEDGKDVSIYINNSKNVVAGSDITVSGDFRLGDG